MAKSYKQFIRLLEHWPIDSTKVGRDLGQHIREQVKITFKAGEVYSGDDSECDKIHASLKRLAENQYGKLYQRKSNSSASGLTGDECHSVMSSEFLEELQQTERSFFSKIFNKKE